MIEYIFPVEYKAEIHWDEFMIQEWIKSKKKYLSFAFNRTTPHTLPDIPFWMYLYYTQNRSDEEKYKGKIRYKFHVKQWSTTTVETSVDIYKLDSTLDAKVWFLCDQCSQVSISDKTLLSLDNFVHPEGKQLSSCLRNSISPAICKDPIREIKIR